MMAVDLVGSGRPHAASNYSDTTQTIFDGPCLRKLDTSAQQRCLCVDSMALRRVNFLIGPFQVSLSLPHRPDGNGGGVLKP